MDRLSTICPCLKKGEGGGGGREEEGKEGEKNSLFNVYFSKNKVVLSHRYSLNYLNFICSLT